MASEAEYKKLKKELEALKQLADKQTHLYKSSRAMLYEGLAKSYLFWREASKDNELLDRLYSEFEIQFKSQTKQKINFSPLLRYLWNMDGSVNSNTIDQWNRALNNMHVEVQNKPKYYADDTLKLLVNFISNSGGIGGLTGYEAKPNDDNKAAKNKLSRTAAQKQHDAHFQNGKDFFAATANSVAQFNTKQTLPLADCGFTLALLRETKNGYEVVGTTDEQALVEQAVIAAYKRNSQQMPNTARLLTEIIRTQALPSSISKLAAALADVSKYKVEGQTRKQLKRLMFVAANGSFVLSENRTGCSVVTVAKPFAPIFDTNEDVALAVGDRTYIENNLIHSGDYNFYTADAAQSVPAIEDEAASHRLQLQNTVTKKYRYVRFYRLSTYNMPSRVQAVVKDDAAFKPIYTAQLDSQWLAEMNGKFLARWVNGLGKAMKRVEHRVFRLAFSTVSVTFGYEHKAKQFERCIQIDLANSAKANGVLDVLVLSKDIVPVLNAIAQLEIDGNVTLQADEEMLRFSFKTECAEYTINVPCCTAGAKRIETYFTEYGA